MSQKFGHTGRRQHPSPDDRLVENRPELRRRLARKEHLGTACPEVQLCVSELLANAIRHLGEGTPVTVRLTRAQNGRVRLAVTDPDPHSWLVPRHPGTDDETGRGLLPGA
ncbi:ATP-binding protein [Streptomyces sp. NPDC057002]|uniref:ATP-binding protein n=1 Tax=Streptomyces sp. NPDC057002 TaxID=3345992 RepID=UPI003627A3BD